jgi:outer membrane protein assembly factor BamB
MTLSCAPRTSSQGSVLDQPEQPSIDLSSLKAQDWVAVYNPERAWNGYTLALYEARIPILLDMNGKIVHSWPEARVRARVRLLPDGSILAIGLGRNVVHYDWEGRLVWEFRRPEMLPHHDIIRLSNGNNMFLVSSVDRSTDNILEVNQSGQVAWEWKAAQHLAEYYGDSPSHPGDITHINSVQELPPNRLHESGDQRFKPGNLLISARNLNAVFVLDRESGGIVWTYDTKLDLQHEALMIGHGSRGDGQILIFDNGYRSAFRYRQSAVIKVDPADKSVAWQYQSPGFYSPTSGVAQPLPNGNVFISSSRGGRVFEVTRGGKIVWQWVPPFQPVRPSRYSYNYCPQMASLERSAEEPVQPPRKYRHVDPAAYGFARTQSMRTVVVDGRRRTFLKDNNQCNKVFLPGTGTIHLKYGLDHRKLSRNGTDDYWVRFGLSVTPEDGGEALTVSEEVDLNGVAWRQRSLDLGPFGFKWAQVCVEAERLGTAGGSTAEDFAYWEAPYLTAGLVSEGVTEESQESTPVSDLTAEELAVRQEHIQALGYLN